jgi:hypothetical protein
VHNIIRHIKDCDRSLDIVVSRYLTDKKFLDLLNRSAVWFSALSVLEELEGTIPKKSQDSFQNIVSQWAERCPDQDSSQAILKMPEAYTVNTKNNLFVNCWRRGEEENTRMWDEYVGNDEGVLILSTDKELSGAFDIIPRGLLSQVVSVNYINHNTEEIDSVQKTDIFLRASLKDKNLFSHENEIRVVLHSCCQKNEDLQRNSADSGKGMYITCNLSKLIKGIILKPGVSNDFQEVVQLLLKKNNLDVPFKRSSLE